MTQFKVYDARGNGNGVISPTVTGDHESRITDYTAVIVYAQQRRKAISLYAVDSHPMDSRISISQGSFPSVTYKIAKGSADGPLVLVRNDESISG